MTAALVEGLHEFLTDTRGIVLLRATDLSAACVDHGDIDLMVSTAALPELLDTLDDVAVSRGLHYRLRRSGPQKLGVELFSKDMAHSVKLDLWEQLWQIFGGQSFLTFEDVEPALEAVGGLLPRLPAVLEASVYVQHLAVKNRDPSLPANAQRLLDLAQRCAHDAEMAAALAGLRSRGEVSADAVEVAETRLRRYCDPNLKKRGRSTRRRTLAQRALRRRVANRTLDAAALVGVDGCGKTSLGGAVAAQLGFDTFLSKDAYRRSPLFRGIYKANRLTLRLPYEPIDNLLTPLTFAVAAQRLPKVVSRWTVLDRYLGDFLVVDRKSDQPRFSHLIRLLSWFHRPCQVVHIRAEWSTISSRKEEFSEKGHAWYDKSMLGYYRSLPVLDYLAFCNDDALESAAKALTRFFSASHPGNAA